MYSRLAVRRLVQRVAREGAGVWCCRPLHASAPRLSQHWFDEEADTEIATKKVKEWPAIKHTVPEARDDYFEVSSKEWPIVEALLAERIKEKPNVPPGTVTPGGYRAPSARIGEHPYWVGRTSNWQPRVHLHYDEVAEHYAYLHVRDKFQTIVSGVDGDIWQLEADLKEYLLALYGTSRTVNTVTIEPHQKIFILGDFVSDVKNFLYDKGF